VTDFLIPRRSSLLRPVEWIGLAVGAALILASAILPGWAAGALSSGGVAVIAGVAGSILKDLSSRRLLSRHGVDPFVTVYARRGLYAQLVSNINHADHVDLMGISLSYALEYIRDNQADFFHRVRLIRILLPATTGICDDRDRTQGSTVGSLARNLLDSIVTLNALVIQFPAQVQVRYFDEQTYSALTIIDDIVWASPYVVKSGSSSPVLVATKSKSPEIYSLFCTHFEVIWARADLKFNQGGG
jgi:hypothetical protein